MEQVNTPAAENAFYDMSADPVDKELILRAGRGDTAAWQDLVTKYQTPVFRFAYLIMGETSAAEDVAQETFIRAFLKLNSFDVERPLRPWLLQIAKNLARNKRRSMGRYWAAIQRFLHYNQPDLISEPDFTQVDSELLWVAVRRLKPAAQEVVYLRYFMELSEAETAVTLDIPPGTVKSRLHRALKKLRQVIEESYPELKP